MSVPELDRRTLIAGLIALPLYAQTALGIFSEEEAHTVEALIDCVIPADEFAGAKEAGVLYYLDKQLGGPLKRFVPAYRSGLPLLSKLCREATGKSIGALSHGERTLWLRGLEKTAPAEAKAFFRMLVEQTMQGFYGGPENGGNRDEASWRMLQVTTLFDGHSH